MKQLEKATQNEPFQYKHEIRTKNKKTQLLTELQPGLNN